MVCIMSFILIIFAANIISIIMDKELFRNELWGSIDQMTTNLCYLDRFRDRKMKIEPIYRGALSVVAILSAILSFFDASALIKITAIVAAVAATAPLLFPILPKSSDFSKMSEMRLSIYNDLVYLEGLWLEEWTDENIEEYNRRKLSFGKTQDDISAVFGSIDNSLLAGAHEDVLARLSKFYPSE